MGTRILGIVAVTALALSATGALAAAANPMAATPPQNELPPNTGLCTSENDFLRALGGQAPGVTCFRIKDGATFAVIERKSGYQQVKLTSGEHKGTTGWTPTLVNRR